MNKLSRNYINFYQRSHPRLRGFGEMEFWGKLNFFLKTHNVNFDKEVRNIIKWLLNGSEVPNDLRHYPGHSLGLFQWELRRPLELNVRIICCWNVWLVDENARRKDKSEEDAVGLRATKRRISTLSWSWKLVH